MSDESEMLQSGISWATISRTRASCSGCRNENSRHTASDSIFCAARSRTVSRSAASSSGTSTLPRKSTRSRTSPVRLCGTSKAGLSYMTSKIGAP